MSSVRNFGIAFVVSLLLFSLLAYFAVGYVGKLFAAENDNKRNAGPDSKKYDTDSGDKDAEIIKSGRSFNAVIIGTDYDPQSYSDYTAPAVDDGKLHVTRKVKATAILFVRFDKDRRAIRVASIPAETYITVDYVPMTLGEAYGYKGGAFLKDRVSSLVGMSADFLFEFSGREFAAFTVKNLLTHDFTVPISVTTTTEKRIPSMTFTKGQTVKSENALFTLLHHTDYKLTEVADRHTLLTSIFLQTLSKLTVTSDPAKYYAALKPLNPDMSQSDLAEVMEVLYTLPLYIGASETPTTVSVVNVYKLGSYQGSTFRMDENAVQSAFSFGETQS